MTLRSSLGLRSARLGLRHARLAATSAATKPPRIMQDESRDGLIIIAPGDPAAHSATFVGPIHGLGDTNLGWVDVALQWHGALPHCKFVLPNAPVAPVTLNMGMPMPSWFDVTSLSDRANQLCNGIEESCTLVGSLIAEELAAGVPQHRIVVGGFSQGGALSLYAGLQHQGQLAGVCVLSGYLPKAAGFALAPGAARTPIAHFHGAMDPTVRIEWARESARRLRELGAASYELVEYAELTHTASAEEIADVQAWLLERLPALDYPRGS